MTKAFAPEQDHRARLDELDERTRSAWSAYSDSLRSLQGREYEEAEHESWERLQAELRDLDGERALLDAEIARHSG
jgi:hypothetical protein